MKEPLARQVEFLRTFWDAAMAAGAVNAGQRMLTVGFYRRCSVEGTAVRR